MSHDRLPLPADASFCAALGEHGKPRTGSSRTERRTGRESVSECGPPLRLRNSKAGSATGRAFCAAQPRTWNRLPDALARAARSDLHVWRTPAGSNLRSPPPARRISRFPWTQHEQISIAYGPQTNLAMTFDSEEPRKTTADQPNRSGR
jgi:hypothetical protein